MLERDVDIFYELVVVRELVDEHIVQNVGIAIQQADPADVVQRGESSNELDKFFLAVQIDAVAGDVLRDEDEFREFPEV